MSNMFDKAKTAGPKETKAKKGKQKREVALKDLSTLANIKSVISALEGLQATAEASVKNQMREEFITEGAAIKRRPENFKGIDTGASASCQIRKRSNRSVLTQDEIDLLEEHDISYETLEDIPETFIINPEHAKDEKLLVKISKALEKVPGLPDDFIQHQASKQRRVVTDDSIQEVFANPKVTDALFDVVAVLATRVKLESDPKDAFEAIMKTLKGKK